MVIKEDRKHWEVDKALGKENYCFKRTHCYLILPRKPQISFQWWYKLCLHLSLFEERCSSRLSNTQCLAVVESAWKNQPPVVILTV